MKMLGHKNIKNTLIYTQLVNFESNEYVCEAARTAQEDIELIEAGFEYGNGRGDLKIYRKPK